MATDRGKTLYHSILVPYQMVEAERIHRSHYASRYVVATRVWESLKVPRGCLVEHPPSITYLGSRLIANPRSGVWVVVITEWVARVAAFILWGAYDIQIVEHPTSHTRLREETRFEFRTRFPRKCRRVFSNDRQR